MITTDGKVTRCGWVRALYNGQQGPHHVSVDELAGRHFLTAGQRMVFMPTELVDNLKLRSDNITVAWKITNHGWEKTTRGVVGRWSRPLPGR